MRILLTLFIAGFFSIVTGCRTPGHVGQGDPAKVSVGMTKEEVIRKLGRPETVMADGDSEMLGYTIERPWWQTGKFRVKLVGGKVQSYEVVD